MSERDQAGHGIDVNPLVPDLCMAEQRIAELEAENKRLREAARFTDKNNRLVAGMLSGFTKPDVDNYLLAGIAVHMALPNLAALLEVDDE